MIKNRAIQISRILNSVLFKLIFLIPIFISYILYKNISIDGFNSISVVSVTAFIQLWLWIIFILGVFLIILYSIKTTDDRNLLNYLLILILILVLTSNLTSVALSLKGTPMPSLDIRGDLGVLVKIAKEASTNFWPRSSSYPPLYLVIIGNLANLLNVHVLTIFKLSEFIFPILTSYLLYKIWIKIVPEVVALIIVIFTNLTFINWKNSALYIILALVLLIYKKIREGDNDLTPKNKIKDYTLGFFVGLLSLWYFGHLWWIILNFSIFILISWLSSKRDYLFSRQIRFYLGFGIIFLPVYYEIFSGISFIYILIFSIFIIFGNELIEFNKLISRLKGYIFGLISPLIMIYIFFTKKTGDTWFEGAEVNPATDYVGNMQSRVDIIVVLLMILMSFFAFSISWFRYNFYFIFGIIISSTIGMFYLASLMYKLNQVNLWPRAKEIQNYSFLLLITLLISSFIFLFIDVIRNRDSEFFNSILNYKLQILIFGIFIFFLGVSFKLSSNTYKSMPMNTFNGAWYAHQACSNPHIDPMLAKTFEEQPDVEFYLRKNCWGKKWPLVND